MPIQEGIECHMCKSSMARRRKHCYMAFNWGLLGSHLRNTHKLKMKDMKGSFLYTQLTEYTNQLRMKKDA